MPTNPAVTTEALADAIGIQPGAIRTRLCRTGSYYGLIPTKLANGRLLWPGDAIEQLTAPSPGTRSDAIRASDAA